MPRPVVRVGIIGGGLMGKEVASAIARWCALDDVPVDATVVAVCDVDPRALEWFERIPSVRLRTADYREVLASPDVDVVYIAVRHDLHEQMYVDAVRAGKDLLAEKPFGIDRSAAERIVAAIESQPGAFVRCSSEMPFFPGAQAVIERVASGRLGRLIEAECWFGHSSDLDLSKPINWKRQARFCGRAGVMNDLGMHVLHVPLRLGWQPRDVYAVLQDLVPQRPDGHGGVAVCDTFENATLVCAVEAGGSSFPLTLATKRIAPGQTNTWGVRVVGMDGAASWSTKNPKALWLLDATTGEQSWRQVDTGSQSAFGTVTGGIFEFGFSDAILQMWAAFLTERAGELGDRFGCVTPAEALASHHVFDAALESAQTRRAVEITRGSVSPSEAVVR